MRNRTESIEKLNDLGVHATRPRVDVLELFQTNERRHLTVEEIYLGLNRKGTRTSLPTVYRTLKRFTTSGLLSRSVFAGGLVVYELACDVLHGHLVCLGCERVDDFSDRPLKQRQADVAAARGYALADFQVALYGYCVECQATGGVEQTGEDAASAQRARRSQPDSP